MKTKLAIYWPVLMMVGTITLACLYDPTNTEVYLPLRFDAARTFDMLSSPYLLVCVAFIVAGVIKARRTWATDEPGFSTADRFAAIWFLMNACWFHTGCDVMSGLFQVMPNLRDAYAGSNGAHLMPMHDAARAPLDAVYWFELLVQLPLCVWTYFLYLRRDPIRPVVVAFLSGLHLTGTVAYYLPYLLMGETTNPVLSNVDRTIALTWIFVPAWFAWHAMGEIRGLIARTSPQPH